VEQKGEKKKRLRDERETEKGETAGSLKRLRFSVGVEGGRRESIRERLVRGEALRCPGDSEKSEYDRKATPPFSIINPREELEGEKTRG